MTFCAVATWVSAINYFACIRKLRTTKIGSSQGFRLFGIRKTREHALRT